MLAVIVATPCLGEVTPKSFAAMIDSVYDFCPLELTEEQRETKFPGMKVLWGTVESDTAAYLPLLRNELQDLARNPYFLFDCSILLYNNSKTLADVNICANAIAHTHIDDIPPHVFFDFLIALGSRGANTFPALKGILDKPGFMAYFSKHGVTMKQKDCIVLGCMQLDEELYVLPLVDRLQKETDTTAIETILNALAFAVDDRARQALVSYIANTEIARFKKLSTDVPTREELPAREIKSEYEDIDKFLAAFTGRKQADSDFDFQQYYGDLPYLVKKADCDRIRKARKYAARKVSDEVMYKTRFLTAVLQMAHSSPE